MAIVTETWFKEGPTLEQFKSDFELGAGLCTVTLCRDPNPNTGVAHGGVAIINKKAFGKFKKYAYPNPDAFEVLPAVGTITGTSRKMVVVAIYIPPNYSVPRGRACLEYVHVKRCLKAVSYTHLTLPTTPYV